MNRTKGAEIVAQIEKSWLDDDNVSYDLFEFVLNKENDEYIVGK